MAENEQEAPLAETEDQPEVTGDRILNLIIHLAEKGAGMAVTVYTSGLCFTGTTCSRRQYLEAQQRITAGGGFAVLFEEILKSVDDEEETETPAPAYPFLHLIGGQVISPGTKGMPEGGVPLRIERDAIVGWHVGKLSAAAD
ncbi:hypothetical protein [Sphingomonas sp. CCH5-D11]|uniref:hypothetical protein n=1 Tax=Sphingomonas sp. CCH5-D11 TaxID=1768786 RepID=UPI000836E2CD|nr:hypothetical protein [Sphingomonas sp. CCH5-D11]